MLFKQLMAKGIILIMLVLVSLIAGHRDAAAQTPDETADEPKVRVVVALEAPINGDARMMASAQETVLQSMPAEEFRLIHRYEVLPGLVGEVTAEGLNRLQQQPGVRAVALDLPVQTQLSETGAFIQADLVKANLNLTGAGVNIAVLDTGVDIAHPDLADSIVAEYCFNRSGCPGSGEEEGTSAQDGQGHGTHVAAIAAGRGQQAPEGIAPGAGIVAVRVLGDNGSGWTSDVIEGIDWVVANNGSLNVRIMNLSLGGGSYSNNCDSDDANTMLYAASIEAARQAGIVTFAASGNSAQAETLMAPACVSSAVSVGSVYDADYGGVFWPNCTDASTAPGQVVCSSNGGAGLDLLAPGIDVTSAALGGGVTTKSGTSMATPHVAGVAALLLQADPSLTPADIEAILKTTGVPTTDERSGRVTPRIDALAAANQVVEVTPAFTIAGTVQLQGREVFSGTSISLSCDGTAEPVATTAANGAFEITVDSMPDCLQVARFGYLNGQKDAPTADLGTIMLPGGNVNGDDQIDIFDLSIIASLYNTTDPAGDVNGDGVVDIFDLSLTAGNYNLPGPTTAWE